MDQNQKQDIREAARNFLFNAEDWARPFAVTLTLKQAIYPPYRELTPDAASQNLRHFLNLINWDVFGKAFKRYGKRLKVVSVLETAPGKRLHYHLLLECPDDLDESLFCDVIRKRWSETRWGYREVDIRPAYEPLGWLNYITKQSNLADALDWENTIVS